MMSIESTEELQLEQSSAEIQEKRWQALFTNVEEGICIVDKNGRIISINPACEVMSGFIEDEALGKRYHEFFSCHDAKGNFIGNSIVNKAIITQEAVPYDEHIHTNKDGEEQWIASTTVPYTNEKGNYECLLIIRDITSYKQVEKLKSDFVSIASHELRTPLTIVNGYLSLLTSGDLGEFADPNNQQQQKQILNKVYLETKRLRSLVEDLLDISRIEEGRLKVEIEPSDIEALIKQTVEEYRPLADGKNLSLEFVQKTSVKKVLCDRNRIKQVLTNLIDNAIKYTQKGGIKIAVKEKDGFCTIQVQDTGNGVNPKIKEKIFEKFQQEPGSYLKENEGTGLGLFIVKGIIELHRGKIWVDSTPKLGSTFYFSIPFA